MFTHVSATCAIASQYTKWYVICKLEILFCDIVTFFLSSCSENGINEIN